MSMILIKHIISYIATTVTIIVILRQLLSTRLLLLLLVLPLVPIVGVPSEVPSPSVSWPGRVMWFPAVPCWCVSMRLFPWCKCRWPAPDLVHPGRSFSSSLECGQERRRPKPIRCPMYDVFPWTASIGKLNLSCDVIVVNHLSHQVIVFEWARVKQQSPDWKTVKIITSHDSFRSPIYVYTYMPAYMCVYIYIYIWYL